MIKAIIFDYGGVLTTEGSFSPFVNYYAIKFKKNPEELRILIKDLWNKAKVNKIDSKIFWVDIAKFLDLEPKKVKKDIMNYFKFRNDVFRLIQNLKKNGYKLALLTNHIEDWFEEEIKNHNLNSVFYVIVTSYNTNDAKPNKFIYKKVITLLKVNPHECIFIDDLKENLVPAKELGIETINYKSTLILKAKLISLGIRTSINRNLYRSRKIPHSKNSHNLH